MKTREPLSGLDWLIVVGLLGLALGALGVEMTHEGKTEIIALVFVALPVALAGMLVARIGPIPAVAAVVAAVYLAGATQTPGEWNTLTHAAATWAFAALMIELLSGAVVLLAGFATIVQNFRRAHQVPAA